MCDEVVVEEVHEVNSTGGVKHIWITAEKRSDESFHQQFRLNTSWIFPQQKLQLATVTPGDTVKVNYNYFLGNVGVMGDFVTITSPIGFRQPVCQCLDILVSDGYQLICPNKDCPLTRAARLERLSQLKFVPEEEAKFWPANFNHIDNIAETVDNRYIKPFAAIANGPFWGEPGSSLSHIVSRGVNAAVGLETFMVELSFREWMEATPQLNNSVRMKSLHAIGQFYGAIQELFQRRDCSSSRQNLLMMEWLWSLGLESLSIETIERLVYHEKVYEDTLEPMLFYTWMLTHPHEMLGELGVDQHQAQAISREMRYRRVELFDLFKHHCPALEVNDIITCFEQLQ